MSSVTAEAIADRSGGPRLHLRERYPVPNALFGGVCLELILWMCAVFLVYYMKTGSWTIGVGWTILPPGDILFLAPMLTWLAVLIVGPRGPFRQLYDIPQNVEVDANAIRWVEKSGERREVDFRTLGGISLSDVRSGRRARLFDEHGADMGELPGNLVDLRSGRAALLSEVVVSVRPDRYEMLPTRFRQRSRSCALRMKAP
jgi:hypothetical protein